ncbi:scavenger receptor cysteine-rich domain-containing group B protein-like, partial [Mustelus asterias]
MLVFFLLLPVLAAIGESDVNNPKTSTDLEGTTSTDYLQGTVTDGTTPIDYIDDTDTDGTTPTGYTEDADTHFNIKLTLGVDACSGRVEVQNNGTWGTVCDDGWGLTEATVVCKHLGCGQALTAVNSSAFGLKKGHIWLDDVNCMGTETSLAQCRHGPWGQTDCSHKEDAGVICENANVSELTKIFNKCTGNYYWKPGDDHCLVPERLRLHGSSDGCSGLLEILYNSTWGTVCDDEWTMANARVVCEYLHCGEAVRYSGEDSGDAKGEHGAPIWLDEVRCRGPEAVLWGCRSSYWGEHDCHHKEDVNVYCR